MTPDGLRPDLRTGPPKRTPEADSNGRTDGRTDEETPTSPNQAADRTAQARSQNQATPTPPPYIRGPWTPRATDPTTWVQKCKDEIEAARERRLSRKRDAEEPGDGAA